jgi:hypothetical protein
MRNAQSFGALSLSFHAASNTSASEATRKLIDCDHIKIMCDAKLALHIRTVLAVWKYKITADRQDANTGAKSKEPRGFSPLKNVKLVLVDHVGKGVFVL